MYDPLTLTALATVTAAAGVLRGYSGFGGGLVMAPFFIRLVGPTESVVLISVIHLLTCFQGVRRSISLVDFRIIGPLTVAAVLSVPLGVLLLGMMEPRLVKTVVAIAVVALAFLSLVAAELTGASSGIGYRLQEARQYIRTDQMFALLIELGVIGAMIDLVFGKLGQRVVHWQQA